MKRFVLISFLFVFIALSLISCTDDNAIIASNNGHSDCEGVYLTINSIDYSGKHKILDVTWHNKTNYNVIYGNEYSIQLKDSDEWKDILVADVCFNEIANVLESNSSHKKMYTTEGFDLTKEGKYRLYTTFSTCDSNNDAQNTIWIEFDVKASKEYKVSYNNPYHSLYEELKPSYKVGERVDVKINSCTDTGYLLLANSKRVSEVYHSNDLGYYWQFSFAMPENDVILEFKTYDGFLQYPNESTLIEAYILAHPNVKSARVVDYYGEYEGGAIVAAMKAMGGEGASKTNEAIDGFDLRYKDSAEAILVLLNSSFYSLKEAYENGYLTNESMQDIERKHKEYYSELYYNN